MCVYIMIIASNPSLSKLASLTIELIIQHASVVKIGLILSSNFLAGVERRKSISFEEKPYFAGFWCSEASCLVSKTA